VAVLFDWDAAYEALPTVDLDRSLIDDEIRKMSSGVRSIMEVEHNFGPDTEKDDGSHRPGKVTVAQKGNSTVRDALSNPQAGSLYLLDDGSGDLELHLYYGDAWNKISSLNHADLDGLSDNDHPQYVLATAGDTIEANLDMGNFQLEFTGGSSDFFLLYGHREDSHPIVSNIAAIKDNHIPADAMKATFSSVAGSVADGAYVDMCTAVDGRPTQYENPRSFWFFPQVYITTSGSFSSSLRFVPGRNNQLIGIENHTGSSHNYRARTVKLIL
jgi:hypothetical protein